MVADGEGSQRDPEHVLPGGIPRDGRQTGDRELLAPAQRLGQPGAVEVNGSPEPEARDRRADTEIFPPALSPVWMPE